MSRGYRTGFVGLRGNAGNEVLGVEGPQTGEPRQSSEGSLSAGQLQRLLGNYPAGITPRQEVA